MAEDQPKGQLTDASSLPPNVEEILYSEAGREVNLGLADDFDLFGGQVARVTILINNLFSKATELRTFDQVLNQELSTKDPGTVKNLALAILGRRLLILDNEWFDGKVSDKLKAMGGNPDDYTAFIADFKQKLEAERTAKEELKKAELAEAEAEKKAALEEREVPLVLTDPAKEKSAAKKSFANYIKGILQSTDYKVKLDLNARLVILMANDDTEQFQKELLDVLYANKELLTTEKIMLKGEIVDPTIGNWLADFIRFVGNDEVSSTIKRAQYVTDSDNPKKLKPEEGELLKKLLDFFVGLKNFYINASRLDFEDIRIIPLSPAEQIQFEAERMAERNPEEKTVEQTLQSGGAVDIAKLYEGKPTDNTQVAEEKERIEKETRREYTKVADIFEGQLLNRKKFGIIACLEILAETSALDNLLAKDPRFTNFLVGYFKRNNLAEEIAGFQSSPYQEKYIRYFLKYVYMERLGLAESEAARLAMHLSATFGTVGAPYTQLAYLDLSDYTFKWGD